MDGFSPLSLASTHSWRMSRNIQKYGFNAETISVHQAPMVWHLSRALGLGTSAVEKKKNMFTDEQEKGWTKFLMCTAGGYYRMYPDEETDRIGHTIRNGNIKCDVCRTH